MKIKFHRLNEGEFFKGGTLDWETGGYWYWDKPNNLGTLHIESRKMKDWRHEAAIFLHETAEALYCKIFRVTTEAADEFDAIYENGYKTGAIPIAWAAGDNLECCYFWGHQLGVLFERIWIGMTCGFRGWRKYLAACEDELGGII